MQFKEVKLNILGLFLRIWQVSKHNINSVSAMIISMVNLLGLVI